MNNKNEAKYYLVAQSGDLGYRAMGFFPSIYEIKKSEIPFWKKYISLQSQCENEFIKLMDISGKAFAEAMKNKNSKYSKLNARREKYWDVIKAKMNPIKWFFRTSWIIVEMDNK